MALRSKKISETALFEAQEVGAYDNGISEAAKVEPVRISSGKADGSLQMKRGIPTVSAHEQAASQKHLSVDGPHINVASEVSQPAAFCAVSRDPEFSTIPGEEEEGFAFPAFILVF